MPNVLGLDLGGKGIGVAIVQQPQNEVLWCGTVQLSDKMKDLYDRRRALRRARRGRKRYRKPKVPQRGGGASGTGERATYFYQRAKGLNQSLRTKCKYVDPNTGETCGKNTPKRKNVGSLLIEDILTFEPFATVPEGTKDAIRRILCSRQGLTERKKELRRVLKDIEVAEDLKKQITKLVFGQAEGRARFCRDHILAHHTQTRSPTPAAWLPPSIQAKQDFLLKVLRDLARKFPIHRVVIERAAFDLQKIAKGVVDDPTEYQQGYRYGFRNTRAALLQEYGGRCCYCGEKIWNKKWHVDHIEPRRTDGANRWDNLAIACEECNRKKGGRNPQDAGMHFAEVKEKVAGRWIKRSLQPKPLRGARIHKYMTQTDQGIRCLERRLAQLFPGAPIHWTYGYVTAAWRSAWGLEKGREEGEHHNDAIVIASWRSPQAPRPIVQGEPSTRTQAVRGKRLFDTNPVQRNRRGEYYQRTPVIAEAGGITPAQLPHIVDPRKKKLLEREFQRYEVTHRGTLPADALQRLPFKSVRLRKKDCSDGNVRCMRTGHRFKLSNTGGVRVNEAVIVYRSQDGKLRSYAAKNRRAFGPTTRPQDFQYEVRRFKPGDLVTDREGTQLGRVVKLGTRGALTLDTGKTRAAHQCRKGGD